MATATRPDVFAYMDAYKVLGLEYAADPSEIRRAHRRLARQHHPDRYAASSSDAQQATARMAQTNDAYALVRDAPLRHHRVSRASEPDLAWSDGELDRAVGQARMNRKIDLTISVALGIVAVILVPFLMSMLPSSVRSSTLGAPFLMLMSAFAMMMFFSVLGPQMWRTLYKVQLALAILHMFGDAQRLW